MNSPCCWKDGAKRKDMNDGIREEGMNGGMNGGIGDYSTGVIEMEAVCW